MIRILDIECKWNDTKYAESMISYITKNNLNIIERLLIWFIYAFIICIKKIYYLHPNILVWNDLKNILLEMYFSELVSDRTGFNKKYFNRLLMETIKMKSILPFVTSYYVSKLNTSLSNMSIENSVRKISYTIGNIFWLADDIADIISDYYSNNPNYVLYCAHIGMIDSPYSNENDILFQGVSYTIKQLSFELKKLNDFLKLFKIYQRNKFIEFVSRHLSGWLKI